jgi:hypothetical protein
MRLPDFLIIGAAKSATTTLYQYLAEHPQIYMSLEKEPNFFGADIRYQRGLAGYSNLFSAAEVGQICGEATTDYTKFPEYPNTAKRIHLTVPNAKFIYLLRNPIDRAYAYYVHLHRRIPYAKRTFEGYIEITNCCLDGSNYMMQIEQYLTYFSKDQFLFIFTDDLIKNTESCLMEVFSFLGVDSSLDIVKSLGKSVAANSAQNITDISTRNYIAKQIKSLPLVKQSLKIIPKSLRKKGYENLTKLPLSANIDNPYQRPSMLPETRELLRNYFAEPNQTLAEFLGRDLSFWQ